jgi:ubiquinone/menaquinone biosynthesis C-methylase UbiE
MMWFNKKEPHTIYLDQKVECEPDIVGDFRDLTRFPDETFNLVLFDPPHCQATEQNKGHTVRDYGYVNTKTFHSDFFKAFKEFWRVLKVRGILIFKWNDHDIEAKHILALADGWQPLFGQKTAVRTKHSSTTLWFCFMKIPEEGKP